MNETRQYVLLSLFVALAIALRGLEALIPNPVPWMRLGLANIMTLLALLLSGLKAGLSLTLLRIVIASFMFGTFLSPPFFISLAAGLSSTLVMGAACSRLRPWLSPVGISVLGGFTHNLTQLWAAYVLVVRHWGIFYLFPFLAFIGMLAGFCNGWAACYLYEYLIARRETNFAGYQSRV
ncbi:heptaprenyl diphosphate synthase [candidate division KSB3 bacterium]|uniref:Heptaprenyl diphosphate synthase n=1 Tax=candidate division KSB3 bacterium TaxID=2044937 RepID=A0A2G6E4Y6_9BACT|nr:MAG: heptaprenyl diphosphate synthase [candidate division KSB3 bacterium]PIE29482.1 MAG: heptaprenyl diphosphate synthase [candidate division KSB3 bacterium]